MSSLCKRSSARGKRVSDAENVAPVTDTARQLRSTAAAAATAATAAASLSVTASCDRQSSSACRRSGRSQNRTPQSPRSVRGGDAKHTPTARDAVCLPSTLGADVGSCSAPGRSSQGRGSVSGLRSSTRRPAAAASTGTLVASPGPGLKPVSAETRSGRLTIRETTRLSTQTRPLSSTAQSTDTDCESRAKPVTCQSGAGTSALATKQSRGQRCDTALGDVTNTLCRSRPKRAAVSVYGRADKLRRGERDVTAPADVTATSGAVTEPHQQQPSAAAKSTRPAPRVYSRRRTAQCLAGAAPSSSSGRGPHSVGVDGAEEEVGVAESDIGSVTAPVGGDNFGAVDDVLSVTEVTQRRRKHPLHYQPNQEDVENWIQSVNTHFDMVDDFELVVE